MRYFNDHRRKLIKQHFIRGTEKTAYYEDGVINMTNTAGVNINNFEIVGNTAQNQYRGHNLFPASGESVKTNVGITVTRNGDEFRIQGTATIDSTFFVQAVTLDNLKSDVKYTGRVTGRTGTNSNYPPKTMFYVYRKSPSLAFVAVLGTLYSSTPVSATGVDTFTEDEVNSNLVGGVGIQVIEGETYDCTVRLELAEGEYTASTFPVYEPFVGGKISPSLDYPQPLQNAGQTGLEIEVRGTVEQPYERYIESQTIAVPDTVNCKDEDGNAVELKLKFIGMRQMLNLTGLGELEEVTSYDRMFIRNGRLFYEKNNAEFVITGNESLDIRTVEQGAPYMLNVEENGGETHFFNSADARSILLMSNIGLSSYKLNALGWPYDYHVDTWYNGNSSTTLYIQIEGFTGLELAEKFKELYDSGSPAIVQYVCEPKLYDLTDTEFGQALLNLKTYYGHNMIMEIHSSPISVSGATLKYYSIEGDDKFLLTIHYTDESGNVLQDSTENHVRCGSRYLVIPPKIDGYLALQDKIEGYLTENSEISIVYKEK